ncbi:hypothetical protein BHF71_08670 [Vulcanibacillus modesticaldus]|uniref:ABC transmembrane type-1 domain-containing protein n=1 Tax=Vulcanibacillus modesticaldus TaxID=337097 RepID=A0A1D2YV68_9BACI|nr:hypothetical protein BHF71_08670 [Vulcanibacillus modesticaldus]
MQNQNKGVSNMELQYFFKLFNKYLSKHPFIKVTLIAIALLSIFVFAEEVGESIGSILYFITHK